MQYVETFFDADVLARELGQAVLGIRDSENLGARIREAIDDLETALEALPWETKDRGSALEETIGQVIREERDGFGG